MHVNGWQLFAFRYFQEQLTRLEADVSSIAHKDPSGFVNHRKAKLLKSVLIEIRDDVPADPTDKKFLLGKTLGKSYKHWRRVKRGLPSRYRLFFRFKTANSNIIYAWLNDENTLRKEGAKKDVYRVFKSMLDKGDVPDSYDTLVSESSNLNN